MTDVSAPTGGNLSELPLQEVLATHARARSSGLLTVTTSAGVGQVNLWDGNIADARFGPAEGEAAIIRLLNFDQGTFAFEARQSSTAGMQSGAVEGLLERAATHQAEMERHAEKVGGMSEVLELDLRQLATGKQQIPDEVGPVARHGFAAVPL